MVADIIALPFMIIVYKIIKLLPAVCIGYSVEWSLAGFQRFQTILSKTALELITIVLSRSETIEITFCPLNLPYQFHL
jgi:hypothetical protein